MSKKAFALFLAIILCFGLIPTVFAVDGSLDNFKKVKTYEPGTFTDVPEGKWYTESIVALYEFGLVNGSSADKYNTTADISLAEVITLAARLRDRFYGGSGEFEQGSPWYQVYVDYALENGIISQEFSNYSAKATRFQFANILAAAFPESIMTQINDISSIPDVANNETNSVIYTLYKAGVLTGSDKYGTFKPTSNIVRSEVAAIITRMIDPSLRQKVELEVAVGSIVLDVIDKQIFVGETIALTATCTPENATENAVTWKSSDEKIASVNASGTVVGKGKGTATITATTPNGKSASCTITVKEKPVDVASIAVAPASVTLTVGKTQSLSVTFTPTNATDKKLSWTSSNSSIASISDDGTITAIAVGTATITAASSNSKTATCAVTVKAAPVPATGISINESVRTVEVGDTIKYTIGYQPANADAQTITWTSSNNAVATVSSDGVVTGIAVGTATITAKSQSGLQTSVSITVSQATVRIILRDSLPKTFNKIGSSTMTSCLLTEFRFDKESYRYNNVKIYISGEKTYDRKGDTNTDSCMIDWRLLDKDGYVVDTNNYTIVISNLRTGDKFRDKEISIRVPGPGTYYIEFSDCVF